MILLLGKNRRVLRKIDPATSLAALDKLSPEDALVGMGWICHTTQGTAERLAMETVGVTGTLKRMKRQAKSVRTGSDLQMTHVMVALTDLLNHRRSSSRGASHG
jgi:hypothetical protein